MLAGFSCIEVYTQYRLGVSVLNQAGRSECLGSSAASDACCIRGVVGCEFELGLILVLNRATSVCNGIPIRYQY